MDRDENAARNILARAVRFAAIGLPEEAMKGNPVKKELTAEVILRADGSQLK